jgi:hypothetical protein
MTRKSEFFLTSFFFHFGHYAFRESGDSPEMQLAAKIAAFGRFHIEKKQL